MYTFNGQGYNHYYGPLYGQGLAPEYQPGHDQAASQRQQLPVRGARDTGTSTRSASSQNESSFVSSVTLKVINPANKKDTKNFVLRPCEIETPQQLRDEILKQYGDKVPHTNDFEVGYFRGQQKVWIMTDDDLNDAWSMLGKGTGSLWCHGVRKLAKQPDSSGEDSDVNEPPSKRQKTRKSVSATEEKQQRVEDVKQKLVDKHGAEYSTMQYRLWAEMVAIDSHSSLDTPPCIPMFTGGRTKAKQHSTNTDMTTVFTSMAVAVIGALKPTPSPRPGPTASGSSVNVSAIGHPSPGKIADIRSKYIQQLRELHSLFEMGALTDKEFSDQKLPILDQLKKFKS